MKNTIKISGLVVLLLAAGCFQAGAQRGMQGMRTDSTMMNRMRPGAPGGPMMMHRRDSSVMRGMHRGMANEWMYGRGQFRHPGWQYGPGMWRGMGPGMRMRGPGMHRPGMGRNQAPGMRIIENIPNLTDKQKKEITDLRQKQMGEMQKLRTDMQDKMKTLRESNRTQILNLLNDDQKKWFNENAPVPVNK